ncbi:MAG: hypothetical protein WAR21_14040, partial [Candidatus Acidiferrales bacterium]
MQRGAEVEQLTGGSLPFSVLASLLDALDRPLLVSDRGGRILFANLRAQRCLNARGIVSPTQVNLFSELLHIDPKVILGQIEGGEQEVDLPVDGLGEKARARIRWLPEPDWLVVRVEAIPAASPAEESEVQYTVQE